MYEMQILVNHHQFWTAVGMLVLAAIICIALFKGIKLLVEVQEREELFKEDAATPRNIAELKRRLDQRDDAIKILNRGKEWSEE